MQSKQAARMRIPELLEKLAPIGTIAKVIQERKKKSKKTLKKCRFWGWS
jgi:hypothetical protein